MSRRRAWRGVALGLVTAAVAPVATAGQTLELGSPLEHYARLLEITGSSTSSNFTIRGVGARTLSVAPGQLHPWQERFEPPPEDDRALAWSAGASRLRLFANTDRPFVANDGAVWQGRGLTTAFDSRASLRWRRIRLEVNPTLIYNQNASFDLAPVDVIGQPRFAYPWRRIDLPQRFGPDPFWTVDPGHSEIAVEAGAVELSLGTANRWWGPGVRNAIVLSDNAPGFLHASLATQRPLDVRVGGLEGQWIWGRLGQSDWFDPSRESERFITGLVLAYTPSFLDGLTLGVTRVFTQLVPDGGVDLGEYFVVFQGLFKSGLGSEGEGGNDDRDQVASLFARWVMPESGFEGYLEWARTDHSGDLADFVQEPEHSRGYVIGFQKVTAQSARRLVVLQGEVTHLESSPTFQLRPKPTYYQHHVVTQGYTHRGQVIGSGVGPGGSAQSLAIRMYTPERMYLGYVERRVVDNDAFWEYARDNGLSFDRHHVQLDLGLNGSTLLGDTEVGAGFVLTRELNRYFDDDEGWNVNLSLTARWRGWSGR